MSKKIPISVTSTVVKENEVVPLSVDPYANNTGKTGELAPILITAKSDSSITFDMPERGDVDDPNAWYDEANEKNLVITKSGHAPVEFAVEFDS